ncbi:zinc ribbon domain-containing protein [Vibrio parahaemolyticus]|uniref:zinc ribbon domain-containing protein n=1 Tax=Vibrio parahaemolyticus TaxID=670 RepID=UPI00084AEE50|nr:zinc ribbon domain-containing protein [Vibrio parahaemolyticus]EGQ9271526.1 DNA ligase [Vibrio parahaemolyticus]EGQ9707999.1 DNA ligase [Vibrio parahaemolyticus]EGQ9795313.1 DNA ligase [Vibrio parahaemolyticus]EIA0903355.1 zinc ribbon domain-containing protein [Vibrio parahaemolyticus]EID0730775.1 zinc ribbon domain-containing protein [Vibrio parahaemolyticus]
MQQNKCPDCEVELEWTGQYHCGQCESDFKKVGFCPDCGVELEKLQACGAANYFCNNCNELKSKSRVRFEFQKIS